MDILPVLDLREGLCSRLLHRNYSGGSIYSENPLEQALTFKNAGFTWLQIVDLDGAFTGKPANLRIVEQIIKEVEINVQFSGGLRSMESIEEAFGVGVARVVLSTAAIRDQALIKEAMAKFGAKIVSGIDTKDGMVTIEGWQSVVPKSGVVLAREMAELGIQMIQYSDVRRDGKLKGPNFQALEELVNSFKMQVISSGGISDIKDLQALKSLGIEAVVIGKALYHGLISMEEALAIAKA